MEDFIKHAKEFGFCAGSYGNALIVFMWEKDVISLCFRKYTISSGKEPDTGEVEQCLEAVAIVMARTKSGSRNGQEGSYLRNGKKMKTRELEADSGNEKVETVWTTACFSGLKG